MKTTPLPNTVHATTVTDDELAIENGIADLAKKLDTHFGLTDEFYQVLADAISNHISDLPMCGYCGEHYPLEGEMVCSQCLVEVPNKKLLEAGLQCLTNYTQIHLSPPLLCN